MTSMIASLHLFATMFATASSFSVDSDGSNMWLVGPFAGIAFFTFIFLRYRNTNKRHAFERETASVVVNLSGNDQKVGKVTDVENPIIPACNSDSPLLRLGNGTSIFEAPD